MKKKARQVRCICPLIQEERNLVDRNRLKLFWSCLVLVRQAKEAEGADNAVMLLTHLTTFIMMLQDERVRAGRHL